AICLFCNAVISCSGATNVLSHLQNHHRKKKAYLTARQAAESKATKQRADPGETMDKFVSKGVTKEQRNEAFMTYIVKDMEEYSTVESKNFRSMICGVTGKPNFQFPNTNTMVEVVKRKVEEVGPDISRAIAGKPLSLTCDGWESRAGKHYYSLTAHLVADDGELKRYTLGCRRLGGRQTGERIAELLESMLDEYAIDKSMVTCFTTDTAANQKKAIRL
ncbi:unnamed protein product, partial [Ectocarpus sp. 8 AP-2014]